MPDDGRLGRQRRHVAGGHLDHRQHHPRQLGRHLHGYDLFADVAPGTPAVSELTADIPGVIEAEPEGSASLLFELEVTG